MNKNYKILEYKQACEDLHEYMNNKQNYLIIHYACQNFQDDIKEKGERITAIAILHAGSLSCNMFSYTNTAQELGLNLENCTVEQLDKIEKELLKKYFEYMKKNEDKKFVHWRMNNNCYGFSVIERRYRQLRGEPYILPDCQKLNLSLLLKKKYGEKYAVVDGIDYGKLYVLLNMNNFKDARILKGRDEAVALSKLEYSKVDFSVSEKVLAFYGILDLAANNRLVTKSKKIKDIYGFTFRSLFQYISDNAILAFVFGIIGGILSALICNILGI